VWPQRHVRLKATFAAHQPDAGDRQEFALDLKIVTAESQAATALIEIFSFSADFCTRTSASPSSI
jgi:hypothetical protein